jgi:hypothetical protein
MAKSKREIILDTLKEGGATMESLAAAADCKYASVMSIFSTLRLMGFYPVKDVPVENPENPEETILTYRIVDKDEWQAILDERAENSKSKSKATPKTPAEALEAATKKQERCAKANKLAVDRANKDEDSQILEWKAEISTLQLKIADSELAEAQMAFDEAPDEVEGDDPAE